MKRNFTLIVSLLVFAQLYAYENLVIRDVNQNWRTQKGVIEKVFITVEPKGLYAVCDLVMELTAESTSFQAGIDLEAEMNFQLPVGADIIDLWLWIDGNPIRGNIMDKWTASLIYESIVKRRIDPAILTKQGSNGYNIKIFPLRIGMPRIIKIQYLLPADILGNNVSSISLPINLAKLSAIPVKTFSVYFKSDKVNGNPGFLESSKYKFGAQVHPEGGQYIGASISDINTNQTLTLGYQGLQEQIAGGTYADILSGEKYFQAQFSPAKLFKMPTCKKALFLVDFIDNNCAALDKADVLQQLQNSLKQSFSPTDSFNIVFYGGSPVYTKHKWFSAHADSITKLFSTLTTSVFRNYTNLPALLASGANYLMNSNGNGSIVLISSSNSHGDNAQANALITDLLKTIGTNDIRFHIINLDDIKYSYSEKHYFGGKYFEGNEYLYSYLSQMTGGGYFSIKNMPFISMLNNTISKTSGYLKSIDIYTGTKNGYTYSNYTPKPKNGIIYFNDVFTQVGKFVGELPFKITVNGQLPSGEVLSSTLELGQANMLKLDSVSKAVWESNNMHDLMKLEQSNLIVNEILAASIHNRILCDYSSFLVLEPNFVIDTSLFYPKPGDRITDVEDDFGWPITFVETAIQISENKLSNYPNPFNTSTQIKYIIAKEAHVSIKIFDVQGREVSLVLDQEQVAGEYSIEFNRGNLREGVYFCCLLIDNQVVVRNKMAIL